MRPNQKTWLFALSPIVLALAACGGGSSGGDGDSEGPAKTSIGGLYQGPLSVTVNVIPPQSYTGTQPSKIAGKGNTSIFLDQENQLWGLADISDIESNFEVQDQVVFSAAYQVNGQKINFNDASIYDDSEFVGIFDLNGSISGGDISLDADYTGYVQRKPDWKSDIKAKSTVSKVSKVTYDYDKAAVLSAIQGQWESVDYPDSVDSSSDYLLKIDAEGVARIVNDGDCAIPVSLKPNAGGKNYFNYEYVYKFDAEKCSGRVDGSEEFNGEVFSGVVYTYKNNGVEFLVVNERIKSKNADNEDQVDVIYYKRKTN